MAAALECWSGRPSTDEDMVEQVLMKTHDRSEAYPAGEPPPPSSSWASGDAPAAAPKKWQRLGRNFAGAITALKNSLNLDSVREPAARAGDKAFWGGIVRNLTQLYPGSQLPEKAISNIRRHFDSLPNSYAQAGHDMKDVLLHVRLIEQAAAEDHPAVHVQEVAAEKPGGADGTLFRLTFASHSPISWPAMADALDGSSTCCRKVQIFEKKGLTLGIATLLVHSATEKLFKARAEAALRSAVKRPPRGSANVVKLPFGLCGCQEQGAAGARDDETEVCGPGGEGAPRQACERDRPPQLPNTLPESSLVVSIDEWQTVRGSGADEIGRWLVSSGEVEFADRGGPNSFRGAFRGKRAWIKKVRGCEKGAAYEVELKRELLELMSCGHRNILHLHGICVDENHGLCLVTRMMDGGSAHDLVQRSKKIPTRDLLRIAADVAEGLSFMNDHGVSYRDLNTQRVLLDKQGNACLGDMGVVSAVKNAGDVTEYETAGYRWLAPEIIAGDPETVVETWMSNVYSFGMVVWEMVTGEAAYSSYSPVQAAVGIAACGLRPEIPKDCPQVLRSLMLKCWNNHPSKRPPFSEILAILSRQIPR
uniref:Serine/threonine-protein kinase HT1 n=1 Tax=Anthurium amnicola TaxID=1678845 RepID=A0A1D1YJD0_9ARAE